MGCRPGVIDMHHGQNPDIELTGPNTAKAKWDLYFYNIDLGARTMMQMSCEYDDEYVKKNGRWWIKKTASKRYSFFLHQVDEDGQPTIAALVILINRLSARKQIRVQFFIFGELFTIVSMA